MVWLWLWLAVALAAEVVVELVVLSVSVVGMCSLVRVWYFPHPPLTLSLVP